MAKFKMTVDSAIRRGTPILDIMRELVNSGVKYDELATCINVPSILLERWFESNEMEMKHRTTEFKYKIRMKYASERIDVEVDIYSLYAHFEQLTREMSQEDADSIALLFVAQWLKHSNDSYPSVTKDNLMEKLGGVIDA